MKQIWKTGIMGVVTGDALGCPVQFEDRETVATHPVRDMRGYGSFNLPEGSWTDDSSLTLALLDSLLTKGTIDLKDIMENFVEWLDNGKYTPYGYSYDIGTGTMRAIAHYKRNRKPLKCGSYDEFNNGNGSLMRILPACLYCCEKGLSDQEAIRQIHLVGSLTHAHIRTNIACGLYYFMIREILHGEGSLQERLQKGLNAGFAFYENLLSDHENLEYYDRLRDLSVFAGTPVEKIRSSGYVVDTLEAAVWSLITTDSFEAALLRAVNLGLDTDTVAAIAGGPAALYYGFDAIPKQWIEKLQRKEWLEAMCEKADQYAWQDPAPERADTENLA